MFCLFAFIHMILIVKLMCPIYKVKLCIFFFGYLIGQTSILKLDDPYNIIRLKFHPKVVCKKSPFAIRPPIAHYAYIAYLINNIYVVLCV